MLRPTLLLLAFPVLTAPLLAQAPSYGAVPGPVPFGGVYSVATGQMGAWSSGVEEVVYRNDAFSGHFNTTGMGLLNVDAGVLATDDNASGFSPGANREFYEVTSFDFSYCTDAPAEAFTFTFYESFLPCTDPLNPMDPGDAVLIATIPTSGLPGSPDGTLYCYTVTIDLTGGMEFCIRGDGGVTNPGWDGDDALDSFGWGYQSTSGATTVGALMAGDPMWTAGVNNRGSGTYYHLPDETRNTGLGSADSWWTADPTLAGGPGCYDFGGYDNSSGPNTEQDVPYASFALVLRASPVECGMPPIGTSYCGPSIPNSAGTSTLMAVNGSTDPNANNVTLVATAMPQNQFGYFLTSMTQGMVFNPGGSQGILCLGGSIARFNQPGLVGFSGTSGSISAQIDTFMIPTSPPRPIISGDTWYFQCWYRDVNPMATSNFSDGVVVTFL